MTQNLRESRGKTWLGGAVVVVLSALLGIWQANAPQPINTPAEKLQVPQIKPVAHFDRQIHADRIEQALAQAGCPGWIVLASEGPQALGPDVVPPEMRRSADGVPRIKYPQPLRLASRPAIASRSRTPAEIPSSPDDPDDLLDGTPDLLWTNTPAQEEVSDVEESSNSSDDVDPSEPESGVPKPIDQTAPAEPDVEKKQGLQEQELSGVSDAGQLPAPSADLTPSEEPGPSAQPPEVEEHTDSINLPQATEPTKEPTVEEPLSHAEAADEELETPTERQSTDKQPEPLPPVEPEPTTPDSATKKPLFAPPRKSPAAPHSVSPPSSQAARDKKPQCEFVAESLYPSAFECAKCHEKIFNEWRGSSHAYAIISPMFHKFEQTINDISQGTIGYFCYRCHTPTGTSLGISRATPLWNLPQVAREGVTCVACHRVNQRYGKVNGERRIEPGNIFAPVYGSIGGGGIAEAIARKDEFKVKTSPHEKGPGQDIHVAGVYFDQLSKPEFCVSCHQVAVHPGIKLEVVWEQYRASPACRKGISCQDCHMGRIPGVPSGYEVGSAALVNEKSVNTHRKHANHVFYGPGYSIAHPGVFPHNKDALRWNMRDWLLFDYRAGWGTDKFEEAIEAGKLKVEFPPVWVEVDDRYDARDIINDNLKKLEEKRIGRQQIMENGSHVDGPYFESPLVRGQDLHFHYIVTNTNEGHNMPSGSLGAQPQLWVNVVLIGPRGQRIWESGYTDRWGDVADIHSEDVRNKVIPYDWQLFNLQTMFLITGAVGTDREFFLPVNVDFDQLPFIRPGAQPISVINHPPFIRMEGRSLAPLGSRRAPYKIPADLIREPGCYRLSFRMRMRPQPIYFMQFCGATIEMQRTMNEWITDFHQNSYEFSIR